jgi:hypothetical protein
MGAEWVGEQATSRPGWTLHLFRFPIPATDEVRSSSKRDPPLP